MTYLLDLFLFAPWGAKGGIFFHTGQIKQRQLSYRLLPTASDSNWWMYIACYSGKRYYLERMHEIKHDNKVVMFTAFFTNQGFK